ncbi:hypothetical protein [Erythrobacter alti]|uniref:hypothetical protein n=1 Tax=Erythrobacter alti TaxID=1896145 RepID=UPI0030F4A3CB
MTWAISGPNQINLQFGPADVDTAPPTPSSAAYKRTLPSGASERLYIGVGALATGTADYTRGAYVAGFNGSNQPIIHYCVLGVPTQLDDRPTANNVSYDNFGVGGFALETNTSGVVTYEIKDSVITQAVNLATGTLNTNIRLVGRRIENGVPSGAITELGRYQGQASFDGTVQTYSADLTSSNWQNLQSNYGGWFFGPQGIETGFSFAIVSEDGGTGRRIHVIGTAIGKR